jgi:hypothetical protein
VSGEPSQVEPGIPPKLTNPLSDVTRKERVYLLAMSAIGITIVFTGLIPTEITALGIKFAQADRKSLLLIFAFVVGYFLVAFGSYALSDYLEWLSARRELSLRRLLDRRFSGGAQLSAEFRPLREETLSEAKQSPAEDSEHPEEDPEHAVELFLARHQGDLQEYERHLAAQSRAPFSGEGPIIILRFVFEFIVPPAVGVFAIVVLVIRAL